MQNAPTVIGQTTQVNFDRQPHWVAIARIAFVVFSALCILFFILGLPDSYNHLLHPSARALGDLSQIGLSVQAYALIYLAAVVFLAVMFIAIGVIIAWRKSSDMMVLLVAFALIGQGVYAFDPLNALAAAHAGWYFPVYFVASLIMGAIVIACYVFPDGRFVPRWTIASAVLWQTWLLVGAFFPTFSINPHLNEDLLVPGLAIFYGSGMIAQIYRYRRHSTPIQRQQTKWIIFGLGLAIGGGVGVQILSLLLSSQPGGARIIVDLTAHFISVLAQCVLPVCIAFAVLRYRLFDIDFLINRGLVYGALTVCLAIVFGLILYLVAAITNQATVALIIAAGAAGLLFQPVRRQLQLFVDRRFYNIWIDYEKHRPYSRAPKFEIVPKTEFGNYKGLEPIGQGGMAVIYKAEHPTLRRPVAIKILAGDLSADADHRERFMREAKAASDLEHRNIVRVFDHGESGGTYYIIMEYIQGADLGQYLREHGRLPLDKALPICHQIASALDYIHEKGIIHRDIKPTNVMLDNPETPDPRAVLMDFGIAKMTSGVSQITTTNLLGTLDYVAPEQIQDSAQVDGRADIYAFGVMVYQLLTGELPFKYSNLGALLIAHMTQPPPNPCEVVPELPSRINTALSRAMAKTPDARFRTVTEFVAALA